jgi:hypothetical protein
MLWLLGFIGFAGFLHPDLSALRVFFLLFLAPLVADVLRFFGRAMQAPDEDPSPELPLPGPAKGALSFSLHYLLSSILTFANPRQLVQMVRQGVGQFSAQRRVGEAPSTSTYVQKVAYTLPFDDDPPEGEWLVGKGGVTQETSHSWELLGQRYAYDFVVADANGVRHSGEGRTVENYYAYGKRVLAPADGEVVYVRDGVRDAPRVGTGWVDWMSPDFRGNFVSIRHAEDEYSFSAHLLPGSIRVRPGEQVRRGDEIGRCGNSGISTEPHLHLQLQDRPDFFGAVGLPVKFTGIRVVAGAGTREVEYLEAGMRVARPA